MNINMLETSGNIIEPIDLKTKKEWLSTQRDKLKEKKNGNTIQNRVISNCDNHSSKTVRSVPLIHWFFTFNNYTPKDLETLETYFRINCKKYIFQEEIGKNLTKHLQGSIHLKKKMRWEQFNLNKKIHWEKTNNINRADEYCQKVDSRNGRIFKWGFPVELEIIKELYNWQNKVLISLLEKPNDRTINWIYDKDGCSGKTVFAKYLSAKSDAIICTGGGVKDIANLLSNLAKNGRDLNKLTTFIFNFGRSCENVSYVGIESVKDGLITNTKFESHTMVFNCPHLWIFSNELPEFGKLSKDRWCVYTIEDQELIPYDLENPTKKVNLELHTVTRGKTLVKDKMKESKKDITSLYTVKLQ